MNDKESDMLDPVVARAREAREGLARQCDYDLEKMVELFKSMEAQHPERVRDPERSLASGVTRAGGHGR